MNIPPPKDDFNIQLYYVEDANVEFTREQYEYIKSRLNKPSWICVACKLNNHHYNQACARCRVKP